MANPANNGHLIGRVGKGGIKQFPNSDGSVALLFSLGVDEDFVRNGKNEPDTDFIPVRAFIPARANGIGSWANVGEGDLIAVNYRLSHKPFTKDGKTVYPDGPTVEIDGYPRYLETKAVTDARKAKKAAAQPAAQPAAAATSGPSVADLEAQIAALKAQQGDASETPFA